MVTTYLSIFTKTFAALAVTALVAAQTLKWDTPEDVRTSSFVLGFSLLMALIGAVIAVLWSVVGTPATTPLGRAIRSGIQALLASPLAIALGSALGWSDFEAIGNLIIPTLAAVALAFFIGLASNAQPVPVSNTKPLGPDVMGTAA